MSAGAKSSKVGRSARLVLPIVLICAGLSVASAMVWQASRAAFTATTQNGVNSFATGSLSLTDNDSNAVLFDVSSMNPGDTLTRCIRVTYEGDITTSNVRLYASAGSATNNLDDYIDLTVVQGTDPGTPTFGSCAGFVDGPTIFAADTLNNFRTNVGSFATGIDTWAPAATNETRDYKFTYTFDSAAPNTVMASTATVTFTWESQV